MRSTQLVTVREGTTGLLVPAGFCTKGPGKSTEAVFYNRQMEFSRDVSILLGRALFEPAWRILDGLAASGARGLRMANECDSGGQFHLNDRNPQASELIRQNARLNGIDEATVHCRDLRGLLSEESFDYIDVDPFGTPVGFIDAAVQACHDKGVLAVTATDTAPLSGTYPKTSSRRYGAVSARSPFAHETGLRILLGHIVREAAKHDRGCEPILSFYADHYFRCHLKILKGAGKADRALKSLGFAFYDDKTLARGVVSERRDVSKARYAGPLWTGELHSPELLDSISVHDALGTRKRCMKAIDLWCGEAGAPPLYYRVDELSKRTRRQPPRMAHLVEQLRSHGMQAVSTHFNPKGFKTDMPVGELLQLFEDIADR